MNPSFEDYWQCPTQVANAKDCKYVFDPQCITEPIPCISTSDYFNACATISSNANVPYTISGYQTAKDGNGFLGFSNQDTTGYREYVQIKLSIPLIALSTYQFSFFINLGNYSGITTDAIGVKFTADSVYYTNQYLWQIMQADWTNQPGNYITDTTDWQQLSGEYLAQGGEQWMIIGIFYPTKKFPSISVNPNTALVYSHNCYYYIDDVTFKEKVISPTITIPNVFTANNDGINDVWQPQFMGYTFKHLVIYNRWGKLIYTNTNNAVWNGKTTAGKKASNGNYYYIITLNNNQTNTIETYKGFIQLF